MDLPSLYQKQISLSEWFANVNHKETENFREEDNWKRERMDELSKFITFPFDKPTSFSASGVVNRSEEFEKFLAERGNEYCALRLIPILPELPKLRMRGMTIADAVHSWLPEQNIEAGNYQADFVPHPNDHIWSSIFVVNKHGVIGEMVADSHNILTQGFHENFDIVNFTYDFATNILKTSTQDENAEEHVRELLSYIRVTDENLRQAISEKFAVEFVGSEYLPGYFESVKSSDFGTWFIDWNRVLGKMYDDVWSPITENVENDTLSGKVGSPGVAQGIVRIIHPDKISTGEFNDGDILLCLMTSPDYVPLMKKAGAVITEEGGILSHAAIVSREMGVTCLVGVKGVLDKLQDGDLVEVNANEGVIKILEKNNN